MTEVELLAEARAKEGIIVVHLPDYLTPGEEALWRLGLLHVVLIRGTTGYTTMGKPRGTRVVLAVGGSWSKPFRIVLGPTSSVIAPEGVRRFHVGMRAFNRWKRGDEIRPHASSWTKVRPKAAPDQARSKAGR